jgi:F420-non-reducing hydrogenase iron-sulfur subunit
MFDITRELVKMLGIDTGRLRLEWISGAEGVRFAEVAREFIEQTKNIGPSELKNLA